MTLLGTISLGLKKMRSEVMGINRRNLELIYPYNPRQNFPNVDDKILCKSLLEKGEIPTCKTLAFFDSRLALNRSRTLIQSLEKFALKPTFGFGGEGVILVARRENLDFLTLNGNRLTLEDIFWHAQDIIAGIYSLDKVTDSALFEELVEPDDILGQVSYQGVPDIRVILFKDQPIMAMLRLPTFESRGVANLHQGAVGVGVDIQTGQTTHAIYKGKVITYHPDNGRALSGITIPEWEKVLFYSRKIPALVGLGYVGIDFVLDKFKGLKVLEVNARPGLQIQLANFKGLRPLIKENEL